MTESVWVLREVVLMLHEQSLAQFGGAAGIRDEGLLDSALGKPQNLFAYGQPSVFDLAASYGFGLVKNHPFIDGYLCAGFVVAVVFLQLNGWRLEASEVDATLRMLALAAGEMSEAAYAEWLKENSRRI
ncbi:MAG: type II toxin-antitoxin system death-on-curing family toxin [Proteobacteria bacterium]|nr:type II toxin-antitoxin system death-on-curing family toxin [Pseudomonadota bacterium]